jgi:hypothetical protein
MNIRIATEDVRHVHQSIKENKLDIKIIKNPNLIRNLEVNLLATCYAFSVLNTDKARRYPNTKYKGHKISGVSMSKLIAIRKAIKTTQCYLLEKQKIQVALKEEDMQYAVNHNLDQTALLGYVAINGGRPIDEGTLSKFQSNKAYYLRMGELLNGKERISFSWLKGIYRECRYLIIKILFNQLLSQGAIDKVELDKLIDNLKVVKDYPSFYFVNQYIHFLCEIVNVESNEDRNLFMTLLSDDEGYRFVANYEKINCLRRA